jgi:hypothetical protein
MCYSAQIESKWKRHVRDMEARIEYSDFLELARLRLADPSQYRLPRGFDLEFADAQTEEERAIKELVDQYRKGQVTKLEMEIFAQRKRQAEGERKLAGKRTAAGHDRMVIRLMPNNVDRWLTPQGRSDEELQGILSERQPAYYEHRVAA